MGRRWCAWFVACTAAAALNSTLQLGPSDRVVYLRIQKTGSKTMVALLTSSWLFAGNGSVTKDAGCLHHAWVGGSQAACERNTAPFTNALATDSMYRGLWARKMSERARRASARARRCRRPRVRRDKPLDQPE